VKDTGGVDIVQTEIVEPNLQSVDRKARAPTRQTLNQVERVEMDHKAKSI
jgi:hypothetical protein